MTAAVRQMRSDYATMNDQKDKAICFTGHRVISKKLIPGLLRELAQILETAISNGYTRFYAGGAIGWDTYCAQMVLDLKEEHPEISLHLILPCSRRAQTANWTENQRIAYDCIFGEADSHEFISEGYFKGCMKLRNQRLVDKADCCICYCNISKERTGTAQTLHMAQKKGIPVINLYDETQNHLQK